MKNWARTLCAVLFLPAAACAWPQPQGKEDLPRDTLAVVGGGAVTAADLLERVDFMPFPGKENPAERESLKTRALESIVAERLLAAEAASRGLGSDSLTALRLAGLERAFVRDQLFRNEVAAGVAASPGEIESGLKKYARELRVVIFRSPTEESARMTAQALLRPAGRPDSIASRDTVTMSFGMSDESLEEHAYTLTAARSVSPPFLSPFLGWVVLRLVGARPAPAPAAQSMNDRLITVKNIIERRKSQARGVRYMASVLEPERAEADSAVFRLLGQALYAIIASDTAAHRIEGRLMLTPGEVDLLEENLRGSLSRTLVGMPQGGLTLGAAIQAFRTEPFTTPSLGRRTFAYVLNESVKRIAREEFLAREGYRKNLQASPAVRHDLETWRANWLGHMMQEEIAAAAGPPTEEEETSGLIAYARLLSPSYEVNVREILLDSLAKASRCREALLAGEDMASLARRVSQRKGWAERGGESGYFHVRSFPELGIRALIADSGALVGPVPLPGGYSLFRVLGKRLAHTDGAMTIDSLRNLIRGEIRSGVRQTRLDRSIAGLAEKFGVVFHFDRLKYVVLSGHNMFTRRYIGFGGMMNAAPILQVQTGWMREYRMSHGQVP